MTTETITSLDARLQAVLAEKSLLEPPVLPGMDRRDAASGAAAGVCAAVFPLRSGVPALPQRHPHADGIGGGAPAAFSKTSGTRSTASATTPPSGSNSLKRSASPPTRFGTSQPNAETTALVEHFAEPARTRPVAEASQRSSPMRARFPQVAAQKIAGLRENYGFAPGQYEFFTVHEAADIAHSGAEWRRSVN